MTKKMLSRRRRLVSAKVRRSGAGSLGLTFLVSSNAALANNVAPIFTPVTHFANPANHSISSSPWSVHQPAAAQGNSVHSQLKGNSWHSSVDIRGGKHQLPYVNFSAQSGIFGQTTSHLARLANLTELPTTQFDLQSNKANIALGSNLFNGARSVTITVGDKQQTFSAGQRVTAGEYLAIKEVLTTGSQTIILSQSGVAVGGSFTLSSLGLTHLGELVIPANVTALDNLSAQSTLTLSGDLLNYGSIYGYSQNSQIVSGIITAKDVVNETGGLISTQLPQSLLTALNGSLSNISLTIDSSGSISNAGKISSTGSLNLVSGNGLLTNSGLIASSGGDINISAGTFSSNIAISAKGGTFQAENGAINLRQAGYAGTGNVTLSGGNYLSNTLNVYSGSGNISGNVENISGQINSQAGVEHIVATAPNLVLGTNTVSGDPTFINNGNITINGVNTFSQDVTIIANGNITATNSAAIVDNGYNVTLIAGVAPSGGSPSTSTLSSASSGITGSTTIDFASSSNKGGDINFATGAASTVIDTSALNGQLPGGNVTLAALAKGTTGGHVMLSNNSTITTAASFDGGESTGNGGNVNIIAGAAPSTGAVAVQVGNITTSGASGQPLSPAVSGTGGTVTITTAQPTGTGGTAVTFNSSGDITAGGPIVASSNVNANAQVVVGGAILTGNPALSGPFTAANGGNINIHAGSNITTGALSTYGSTGYSGSSNTFAVTGGNGAVVDVTSDTGSVTVNGAISTYGGNGGSGSPSQFGVGSAAAGGTAGAVTINAAGAINVSSGIAAQGGNGGNGATGYSQQSGSSGAAGGNGGIVQVTSSAGGISIGGNVAVSGGSGGFGGNGSAGAPILLPVNSAGSGGNGGNGGQGGGITVNANSGNVVVSGALSTSGGSGGAAGAGGAGLEGPDNTVIQSGSGGNAGNGGSAGVISLTGATLSTNGGFNASGGAGGTGGAGGAGSTTAPTIAGGKGGNGGAAGAGANITIVAANLSGPVNASGGIAGAAGSGGTGIPDGTNGSVGNSAASGNVAITASGSTSGAISGNNVSLEAAAGSNGAITLADNITAAGTLTIKADGTGSVTQTAGLLTAQGLTVDSGTTATNLNLNFQPASSAPLTLSLAVTGNVTLSVPNAINFSGSSAANGGTFAITSGGAITLLSGASITAGTVNLATSSTSGGITQQDPLSVITITANNASIMVPGSGNITLGTSVANFAGHDNGGNVALQNTGAILISGAYTVGSFGLQTSPNAQNNGAITLATGTTIGASGAVSLIASEASGGAGGVTQQDAASGTTVSANSLTVADNFFNGGVSQGQGSGSGNISLTTQITNLTAATGSGLVSVQNTGAVNLFGNNSAGSFNLTTAPDKSGNGGITLAFGAAVQATSISLSSSESGSGKGGIIQSDPLTTTVLTASNITLSDTFAGGGSGSGTGEIAVSLASSGGPVTLAANTTGNVILNSGASVILNASSGQSFNLTTSNNSAITVDGNLTSQSNVAILASGSGAFTVNSGVAITGTAITITGSSFALDGTATINAGAKGSLSLATTGAQTIAVGDASGTSALFDVSASDLSRITAASFSIGNLAQSGNLEVFASLNQFAAGITLSSAGQVTIDSAVAINANNITINGSNFILGVGATLNAGSGTITLAPSGLQTIGLNGTSFGTFIISAADLIQITAGTLVVGNSTRGGNLEILSSLSQFATALVISTTGDITAPSGAILQSGSISLTSGGNIGTSVTSPVYTDTNNLSANAAGNAYLSNNGSVSLGTSSAGATSTFALATTPGLSGSGSITVTGGAVISGGTVSLASSEASSGGTGGINQISTLSNSAIQASNINLSDHLFVSGVDQGAGTGYGNITIGVGYGSSGVTLSAATAGSITLTANTNSLTVANGTNITGASINISGQSLTGLTLTNSGNITALDGDINVASAPGQQLSIGGGGTLTAPGTQSINLTATDNPGVNDPDLVFVAGQTFAFSGTNPTGVVNLNASGSNQLIVINSGATLNFPTNNTSVVLNSTGLILNGAINLNNPPNSGTTITLNAGKAAGVIANSSTAGIDLSQIASLTFSGENLTILSAGNITDSGQTLNINLSNSGGSGGQLGLLAGFNFIPVTAGVVGPTNSFYTITSSGTGSIMLANTSINTSGSTSGGDVLAVANGSVALGAINTTGTTGNGGSVTILGQGITVGGLISTTGATAGRVNISSAGSSTPGTVVVLDGIVTGSAFQANSYAGVISLAGITAGNQTVTIATGGTGSINSSAALNAGTIILTAGSGGIGSSLSSLAIMAANVTANAGINGNVFLTDSAAKVTVIGANTADNFSLTASGTNGSLLIGAGASINGVAQVLLSASGSGTIDMVDNSGAINASSLVLISAGGNIGASNAIATDAGTITASAFNGTSSYGNVSIVDTASSVTLARNAGLGVDNTGNVFNLVTTTGSIVLGANENLTGHTSVTLVSQGSGTIDMADGTGNIITPTLTLSTAGTTIGANNAVSTNATTITASAYNGNSSAPAYGSVALKDSATAVTLAANSALSIDNIGQSFTLTATGDASKNGSILLGANEVVTGIAAVTLIAAGNGTIDMQNATAQINSPVLSLVTAGGNIGVNNAINTNAGSLTAYAFNGNVGNPVYGNVTINDSANSVTLVRNAALSLDNVGNNFSLSMTSANGSILIGSNEVVHASTSVTLRASGTGTIDMVDTTGLVSAANLTLITAGGAVGANNAIQTNSTNLTAYAFDGSKTYGNVNVLGTNGSTITLAGNSALGLANVGDTFAVTANSGTIVIGTGGSVTGNTAINLTATSGGSIEQTDASAVLTSNAINLVGHGGIGNATTPIFLNTANLSADGGTTGDVYLSDSAVQVTLSGVNTANNYNLTMTDTATSTIYVASNQSVTGATSVNINIPSTEAALIVDTNGTISAPDVFFSGEIVDNEGTIQSGVGGTLALNFTGFMGYLQGSGSYIAPSSLTVTGEQDLNLMFVGQNWIPAAGSNVLFVAGEDIINYNTANQVIDVSSTTGNGGNVTIIAGANYSYGTTPNIVNINGASATGGNIVLDSTQGLSAITTSGGNGGSGGSVNILAFSGSRVETGQVNMQNVNITTGVGGTGGMAGGVTIIAPYNITVGAVTAVGPAVAPVIMAVAQPDSTGVSFNNGVIQGTFGYGTPQFGSISFTSINVGQASISLVGSSIYGQTITGHNIEINNPDGVLEIGTALNILPDSNGNGGTFSGGGDILLPSSINASGTGSGNGGTISLQVYDGTLPALYANSGPTGGNGGTINVTVTVGAAATASTIQANPLGTNGNGGTISLISGGTLDITGNLSANGAGTGNGGNITLKTDSTYAFVVGNTTSPNGISGTISAMGAGGSISITNAAGGLSGNQAITASQVSLASSGGDIGSSTAAFAVNTSALTVNTTNNAYISNTGSFALNPSVAANLTLISNGTISTSGSTTVTQALQLTAPGVTISGADALSAGSVTINAPGGSDLTVTVANNSGSLTATTGDVSINGATGNNVVVNNAGVISSTNGNVSITSTEAVVASNAGGNIAIGGGGTLQVGSGLIDITAATQAGSPGISKVEFTSNQSFSGDTVINVYGTSQLLQIDNDAVVTGNSSVTVNGNTIYEVGTGTITGNPLIVNSQGAGGVIATTGTLDLSGLGSLVFNGQNLVIMSEGNITDNNDALTIDLSNSSGAGGSLTLIAGFNFTPPQGKPNYPPLDTTSSYVLGSASAGSIDIGSTTINTSGSTSGGNVTAVATGGSITLGQISANGGTGTGGNVKVIGGGIVETSSINVTSSAGPSSAGSVSLTSANAVISGTIIVGGGFVSGGTFLPGSSIGVISTAGPINAGANSVTLTATGADAGMGLAGLITGGNINITTSGTFALTGTSGFSIQNDASGNGGNLSLTATYISWQNSATQPLVLNASANGASGNGGTIQLAITGTAATNISTQAGAIELIANGGTTSGNGGVISLSAGGNLTAAPGGISVGPLAQNGNGGQISLTAGAGGNGKLLVSGSLNADGAGSGSGGIISLTSDSSTVFNLGSTAKTNTNGVQGGLSVKGNGGTLEVSNLGGGITNAVALNSVNNLYEQTSGSGILALGSSLNTNKTLNLVSLTVGTGTITKSGTLTTNTIELDTASGNIGTVSAPFTVIAKNVQANSAGVINISDTIKTAINLEASTAGTSFKFVGSGLIATTGAVDAGTSATITESGTNLGISLGGNVAVASATGTVTITATGTGTITQSANGGSIEANTVTLKTTSGALGATNQALRTDATILNLTTTGAVNIANSGATSLTENGSTTKGAFSLSSAGNITIAKPITTASSISVITDALSNGNITLNSALGGTSTTLITVNAAGIGNIITGTSGKLQTKVGDTINLTSGGGNIGSGDTTKTALTVYTTNLSANTSGSGLVNVASKLTSALTLAPSTSGGNFTLNSAGPTVIGNINASSGGITVIESTGALKTAENANLKAGDGGITIENANKSTGTIEIQAFTTISTVSTLAGGGQVNIVIGPVPTAPVAGTTPANVTVNNISGGNAYFGKGITINAEPNTLNLKGSNIVFNVGTRPITAIALDGGITITADPVVTESTATLPVMSLPTSLAVGASTLELTGATHNSNTITSFPSQISVSSFSSDTGKVAATIATASALSYNQNGNTVTSENASLAAGTLANAIASNLTTAANSASQGTDVYNKVWLSETELSNGQIPALVFEGEALGIQNEISQIIDMEELNTAQDNQQVNNHPAQVRFDQAYENPLVGHVDKVDKNVAPCKMVNLNRGSVVFAPLTDTLVHTSFCSVQIAAHSVAMVIAFEKGVAIYNLMDTHKDAIVIKTKSGSMALSPGSVSVISANSVKGLQEINPTQAIGYRNIQDKTIDADLKVFSGQFSLPQAVASVLPLRAMVASSNPKTKNVSGKLLKTAAILTQINGYDYAPLVKPTTTAYAN